MGRPPSLFNRSNNQGGPGVLQNEGYQATRPRHVVVNIPPVDPEIEALIRQRLQVSSPLNTQLQALRGQLSEQIENRKKLQAKLDGIHESQRLAMEEIRQHRRQRVEKARESREKVAYRELKEHQEKRKRAWRETIEKEAREEIRERKSNENKQQEEDESKLRKAKADLNASRQELSVLNVQKVDMIWLLKRVIKAEEKERSKSGGTGVEAKIAASKQA